VEKNEFEGFTQGKALDLIIWLSGYTHSEVAEAAGISRSHMSNMINDNGAMTQDVCDRVAEFLGVLPNRLCRLEKRLQRRAAREQEKEGVTNAT
jgi:plasmid maintenance system antidote protein VapI